jgi:hypothetical protein
MRAAVSRGVGEIRRFMKELVRRGVAAAPRDGGRRRVVLVQIDGLSSRRLTETIARGDMPNLAVWLASGKAKFHALHSLTAPSTPVFTAGLLYGARNGVPGFCWYDRALRRQVRMDFAEDVSALESGLAAERRPLLEGGTSYGTIWTGGAADAFFNVVRWDTGAPDEPAPPRNAWDGLVSALVALGIAARVSTRLLLELAVGLWDFQRWYRRVGTTRFEWRFLYMRLFVAVVMRDVATAGAVVDILRGVPRIFVDYLGYDEYAHRRGPDAELTLYNLRGIDDGIGKILRAVASVPEYAYDVFVFSDHGQMRTTPFARIIGCDLLQFVLGHLDGGVAHIDSDRVRKLVTLRATELWARSLPRGLRNLVARYVAFVRRRLRDQEPRDTLDAVEVVTGGSVANIYFDRRSQRRLTVEEIEARHPELLSALEHCRAIGLMVGQSQKGPLVFSMGRRYLLDDRQGLAKIPAFHRAGYKLVAPHLAEAASGPRHGDLVLYGAGAPAGDVAFDFEFGSHGGIGAEELEQFICRPVDVELPPAFSDGGAVAAEEFYGFFADRYGCES